VSRCWGGVADQGGRAWVGAGGNAQIFTSGHDAHPDADRPRRSPRWAKPIVQPVRSSGCVACSDAAVHNFGDGVLLPGFNDAHQHPSMSPNSCWGGPVPEWSLPRPSSRAAAGAPPRAPAAVVLVPYDHTKSTGAPCSPADRTRPAETIRCSSADRSTGACSNSPLRATNLTDRARAGRRRVPGRGRSAERVITSARCTSWLNLAIPAPTLGAADGLRRYQRNMHSRHHVGG